MCGALTVLDLGNENMLNRFRNWIPFWKKESTVLLEDTLLEMFDNDTKKLHALKGFFVDYGDLLIDYMEKASFEKMKEREFTDMTDVEKGMLGYGLLSGFMQQLMSEHYVGIMQKQQAIKAKKK